jgi:hypothetical protein
MAFGLDNREKALDGMIGVDANVSLQVAAAAFISLNLLRLVLDRGEDAAAECV